MSKKKKSTFFHGLNLMGNTVIVKNDSWSHFFLAARANNMRTGVAREFLYIN